MLSRVAERLYWLARYLERTEDTARLILVWHQSALDMPRSAQPGWDRLLESLGAQEAFAQLPGAANEKNIVSFVFSERSNPSSIISSLTAARENMRTTREIMPSETWVQVNSLYLSVARRSNKPLPKGSRHVVLNGVINTCQQIAGNLSGTMNHNAAYQFVRMGRALERADMTTRIIDVASADLTSMSDEGLPYQNMLWISVLRSLSAYQSYRLGVRARVNPPDVVEFLLASNEFPRALAYCLREVEASMKLLPRSGRALKMVRSVLKDLDSTDCSELVGDDLHQFIDDMQLHLQSIGTVISETWLSPDHKH